MDNFVLSILHARNALVPLNALPVELLADIFYRCIEAHFPKDEAYQTAEALRLVCSHWNTVMRTFPKLWAFVSVSWPDSKNERALEWSGTASLAVWAQSVLNKDFMQMFSPLSWRWKSAWIMLVDQDDVDAFKDLPVARLEKLDAIFCSSPGRRLRPVTYSPEGATMLRKLSLTGFPFTWSSTIFQGLLSLEINALNDRMFSISALVDVLKGCSRLEQLKLSASHPEGLEDLVAPFTGAVEMNSLCSIQLQATFPYIRSFFDHVRLPALCDATILFKAMGPNRHLDRWVTIYNHVNLIKSITTTYFAEPPDLIVNAGPLSIEVRGINRNIVFNSEFLLEDRRTPITPSMFNEVVSGIHQTMSSTMGYGRAVLSLELLQALHEAGLASLDDTLPFTEVRARMAINFKTFVSHLDVKPAQSARASFQGMDTLRLVTPDTFDPPTMDRFLKMLERRYGFKTSGDLSRFHVKPKPLEVLELVGPRRPDRGWMSLLEDVLGEGVVRWVETGVPA